MIKVKVNIKNILRYGFILEEKQDKVKVCLFDTPNFASSDTFQIMWGHHIKNDWFEKNDIEEYK